MSKRKRPNDPPRAGNNNRPATTLADVPVALKEVDAIPATRLRDLCSCVQRVAALLGKDPAAIELALPAISVMLATVNPVAAGMSAKTLANLRSGFLSAVKLSGLHPVQRLAGTPLSPAWAALMTRLPGKRAQFGLSRLARYASAHGIDPGGVTDAVIADFITAVREGSLHRRPNVLHRQLTLIWDEVAQLVGFQSVTVASFLAPIKRVPWSQLTPGFRNDVESYLEWCGGGDVFAADARPRPLAPRTLKLRRNQIHAGATALIESGVEPSDIRSLPDLVTPENFKRILSQRFKTAGGRDNAFNRDLAEALVQIGREWVKVEPSVLAELKRLTGKLPMPASGLTSKNKASLRQFDDPALLRRLLDLPGRLWAEVKREAKPSFRTLAKAQAALAVTILTYIPLRLQNLVALMFDVNLFIREEPGAISTLELAAAEMKNKETEMAFDIPPKIARMLIEYRDRIAPKVIGRRPERVFVNADGTPKSQATVAWLVKTYLARYAGIRMTGHQFRHLSAKNILDAEPGSFETVRQLLGHKNHKTTTNFYAGIDTRRAGRHHRRLIERALDAQKLPARRKKPPHRRKIDTDEGGR